MDLFNSIRVRKQKKNLFSLSHNVLLTADYSQLIPFYAEFGYPGDYMNVIIQSIIKSLPVTAPIMHNVTAYLHFFEIPLRLCFGDHYEAFITGKDQKTGELVSYDTPMVVIQGVYEEFMKYCGPGSLIDYLGFPVPDPVNYSAGQTLTIKIPKYILNAYLKVYNDYYRDENQDSEIELDLDPSDTIIDLEDFDHGRPYEPLLLRQRCWPKDYFTSALPDAQQGPDVMLPLGSTAPLKGSVELVGPYNSRGDVTWDSANQNLQTTIASPDVKGNIKLENTLEVDLSQATGVTINELRLRTRVQRFLELMARGGSRYIEQLFAHFGERSDDARLQRANYLGGGRFPINVLEIQNQTGSIDNDPLGSQAGTFFNADSSFGFKKKFKEHTIVLGILSIMPQAVYMQGYPRKFAFKDRYEMYWPSFAHLGEQEVKNKEVFYNFLPGAQGINEQEFGYQSRYSELKHNPSRVCGQFRLPGMMNWHLARFFTPEGDQGVNEGSKVNLNSKFLRPDIESMNRSFPVLTNDAKNNGHFYVQMRIQNKALRPMPKYGTPML